MIRVLLGVALATLLPTPAAGQARLVREAEGRAAPDGNVVAELRSGTSWASGTTRNGWTLITIAGWVDASRFAGRRDSFPESIGGSDILRVRERPSLEARILGEFRAQAGVRVLERRGAWARVRRDVWVRSEVIAERAAASKTPTKAPTKVPTKAPSAEAIAEVEGPPAGAQRATTGTPLLRAPGGEAVGTLAAGAIVEPLARERGMVRVRLEAWVPDSLLAPADSTSTTLTAADLRQDPAAAKGKVVKWAVQVVGLQRADVLRRDLGPDEPYLLALGPGAENAILYVAVPAAMLDEARELAPMARMWITARVRSGRSEPTGAPVLDLLTMSKR